LSLLYKDYDEDRSLANLATSFVEAILNYTSKSLKLNI